MFYEKKKCDSYSTPIEYLKVIEPLIPKTDIINDPFYFNGKVKELWKELNRDIIHENKDFFTNTHEGDCFISNPPYTSTLFNKILSHLFLLNKKFILLIPIEKICNLKTQKLIRDKNIQVIPSPIYKGFLDENNQETRCSNFYCCFLCWKMDLPKDLVFL